MSDAHSPDVRIVHGAATEEEVAALIAVVTQEYLGQTEEAVMPERVVSAWERTQRAIRTPLRRDIGWGHFSG